MTEKMLNIGPKSAAWLRQVGVRTYEDLEKLGAVGVFLKVKRAGFRPSLNLLYALAGAQQGCHWTALSAEQKSAMVLEVSAFDDAQAAAKKKVLPCREVPVERSSYEPESAIAEAPMSFDEPDAGGAGESESFGDPADTSER